MRRQLALLCAGLAAPILVFVGVLLWQFASVERARTEAEALAKARNMALAVDRVLGGMGAALTVLATSQALRAGDLEGFYRVAAEMRDRTGYWVVLIDRVTRQQLVNTRLPWGTPLPLSNIPDQSEGFQGSQGAVGVSNVFEGAVAKKPVFAVHVTVERGEQRAYVVNLSVPVGAIRDVIVSEEPPWGSTASVVDRTGRILARSQRHDELVGKIATQDYLENTTGPEGTWHGTTVDGQAVFGAFARSRLSDWRIGIGVPESVLNAPLQRSLLWLAALGVGLTLLSVLFTSLLSQRIVRPILALADRAQALGRGEPIGPVATPLREVAAVGDALAATAIGLRERERELRESEARYRLILENATDIAMITTDLRGRITSWNPGAVSLLGWSPAEAIGQSIDLMFTAQDQDAGVPETELGTAMSKGRAADERWKVRKDGSRFFAAGALLPMRGADGVVVGFLKILRDRTEQRRAEEAMRNVNVTLESLVAQRTSALESVNERLVAEAAHRQAAEEQLRQAQKMEAVGRLTGGIAHDFNNLLTVVTGNLDMLRRRVDRNDPRVQRFITNALDGANRAAALTYRLLAFSRQHPLAPQPVDANKLVAGMSDLLRRTLGEDTQIETVLAGGLWRSHADPNQLENALLNLAVNARDAMPDGGKLTIETQNTHLDDAYAASRPDVTPGQYVMIAVCDTGSGMAPDTLARAFEPFFTTKPVGKGTGLGLAQVYGFAKQSGGHVGIYSELGQGTIVKLYLPRFTQGSSSVEEIVEAVAPTSQLAAGRGETVLVVEDEAMVREFSVMALDEAGYRVLSAEDGPSGLALLDAHSEVALLFTDVVLTGPMNGRKVADEAVRRRPNLKVLFTTGYTRNAIIHQGRLDQGVELITKPFTATALTDRIGALLDGPSQVDAAHFSTKQAPVEPA